MMAKSNGTKYFQITTTGARWCASEMKGDVGFITAAIGFGVFLHAEANTFVPQAIAYYSRGTFSAVILDDIATEYS